MRSFFSALVTFAVSMSTPGMAVNTWAGSTADDMAQEVDACAGDADKFCGGNTIFIFEMEDCLKRRLPQLSKACRKQLSPTDFKKYYNEEPHPLKELEQLFN